MALFVTTPHIPVEFSSKLAGGIIWITWKLTKSSLPEERQKNTRKKEEEKNCCLLLGGANNTLLLGIQSVS